MINSLPWPRTDFSLKRMMMPELTSKPPRQDSIKSTSSNKTLITWRTKRCQRSPPEDHTHHHASLFTKLRPATRTLLSLLTTSTPRPPTTATSAETTVVTSSATDDNNAPSVKPCYSIIVPNFCSQIIAVKHGLFFHLNSTIKFNSEICVSVKIHHSFIRNYFASFPFCCRCPPFWHDADESLISC